MTTTGKGPVPEVGTEITPLRRTGMLRKRLSSGKLDWTIVVSPRLYSTAAGKATASVVAVGIAVGAGAGVGLAHAASSVNAHAIATNRFSIIEFLRKMKPSHPMA